MKSHVNAAVTQPTDAGFDQNWHSDNKLTCLVVGEVQDLYAVWVGDVCGLGLGVEVDLSTESFKRSPMEGCCEAQWNRFDGCFGAPAAYLRPSVRPHHSLVSDLFGVSIEKGDFDRLSSCRHFFPGAVGKDGEAISVGQNLLGLKWSEPVPSSWHHSPQTLFKTSFLTTQCGCSVDNWWIHQNLYRLISRELQMETSDLNLKSMIDPSGFQGFLGWWKLLTFPSECVMTWSTDSGSVSWLLTSFGGTLCF